MGDTDKDLRNKGVMLAFTFNPKVSRTLALPGGDKPDQLHMTLAYYGKEDELTKAEKNCLKNLAYRLVSLLDTFELIGRVSGLGFFENPDSDQECLYASIDIPGLNSVYHWILTESRRKGLPMRGDHGFTPHITLRYQATGTTRPSRRTPLPEVELKCANLVCKIGTKTYTWDGPGDTTECEGCGYENCLCIEMNDNGKNFKSYYGDNNQSVL